jgi:hypothetical protein
MLSQNKKISTLLNDKKIIIDDFLKTNDPLSECASRIVRFMHLKKIKN